MHPHTTFQMGRFDANRAPVPSGQFKDKQVYQYATFQMGRSEVATHANQELAANGNLYGIEVTIPALAALCTLGNLDPQHSGEQSNVAACIAALTCPLPQNGATLVTTRPDADSLAAMAVLTHRAEGWGPEWLTRNGLLAEIAAGDTAPTGPWIRNYRPPAAFSAANVIAMNHQEPLGSRIDTIREALLGTVKLPETKPNDYSAITVSLSPDGRYAISLAVGEGGRGVMGAGYRSAPVVVAQIQEATMDGRFAPHLKYSIGRWNDSIPMDWDGMVAELRALEPGWGGSSSIIGSTQGEASPLTLEQVIAAVERHLRF